MSSITWIPRGILIIAVRAGFKACWRDKDYPTIVKVAQRIPEAVIQEDSSLLMYFNNALTRTEG